MTVGEQIWFVVAMGGFLIFLQAAVTTLINAVGIIWKTRFSKSTESDTTAQASKLVELPKMITGAIIFIMALVYLFMQHTA
jgi:hypothetical protein